MGSNGLHANGVVATDGLDPIHVRALRADESARLGEAIRAAYGDTFDDPWVYDAHEVAQRISDGLLVSCIAESENGRLLCHGAMSFRHPHDQVGHVGQAVTVPDARGQHLYTSVKRHLVYLAKKRGLAGLYSETTAAHPYSQMANIELGAHETGFLLGWIPATVDNNAAESEAHRRRAAALFYLRTNAKPARLVFAPPRHRDIIQRIIGTCRLHARLAEPTSRQRLEQRSKLHTHQDRTHNLVVVNVTEPGADLTTALSDVRARVFDAGFEALYVDLPLELAATAQVADHLEALGVSFAGIFPNSREHGDVLRLQTLNGVRVTAEDVAVASDHGRELLDYVLADLSATGHAVA
jgi:serine/threonine-protein kinase RsbW